MRLREVADKAGWNVVEEFVDRGISGAKGRDKRPAFDRLCMAATRREIDVVMAWSVDRLGRSLQDLVAFLSELQASKVDLRGALAGARESGQALVQIPKRPFDSGLPALGCGSFLPGFHSRHISPPGPCRVAQISSGFLRVSECQNGRLVG